MPVVRTILFEPLAALERAAKKKDWNRSLKVLFSASAFGGLAGTLWQLQAAPVLPSVLFGVYFTFALVALGAFAAFLLELPLHVLAKGRGHFYEALTAVAYSAVPVSIGWLLAALLSIFPVLGPLLAVVPVAAAMAYGAGLLFASLRDLFKVDAATVFMALAGLCAALWAVRVLLALSARFIIIG
jgi:hypothetical protein